MYSIESETDLLNLTEALRDGSYVVAVVLSNADQSNALDRSGSNRSTKQQQSLLLLSTVDFSTDHLWICINLTSITTHIR